jgi:hypothetical protein
MVEESQRVGDPVRCPNSTGPRSRSEAEPYRRQLSPAPPIERYRRALAVLDPEVLFAIDALVVIAVDLHEIESARDDV